MINVERPEPTPIRSQQVPQSVETPMSFAAVPGAYVRYAYARSSESMAAGSDGQDYLCFKHNDQRLVFALCDGVGSSFCGNLAARLLGDYLLDWLWSLDIEYIGSGAALSEAASGYLNRVQKQAQYEVEAYEIPAEIGGLVRQALEAQRAYGSEAVFVAGRIDHPGILFEDGLCSLVWAGDARLRALDHDGAPLFAPLMANANRWSTAQGVKGQVSAWQGPLKQVSRVVAFSDGLSAHEAGILDYGDTQLDRAIYAGALLPSSDDVSFIDIVLRGPLYEGYADPDLPDLAAERPHLEQIWNPTGADRFTLRWGWPGQPRAAFLVQEARSPALTGADIHNVKEGEGTWQPAEPRAPGAYYYRVRSVLRGGRVTPWSELRYTRVAFPPPPAPLLRLEGQAGALNLAWDEVGEALDYRLEMAEAADFEGAQVLYEGRGTAWAAASSQVKPGTYFFRVRAASSGVAGAYSQPLEAAIYPPPPPTPQPSLNPSQRAPEGYDLRWLPVSGASYYEIEESLAEDDAEPSISRVEEALYTLSGLEPGRYSYRVRACHDHACSAWSAPLEITVRLPAPAQAPSLGLDGPDENGLLRLTWSAVAGAESYNLEIADDRRFSRARMYSVEDTTLEISRREPGMIYARVCAVNASGEGPWSASASVGLPPTAPGWIEAEHDPAAQTLKVAWGSVPGQVTYRLEMGGPDGSVALYSGEATQFSLSSQGLRAAMFRVRAEAGEAVSGWQAGDMLLLSDQPAQPAGSAPELLPLESADSSTILLRWNAVPGAAYYIIDVHQAEKGALHTQQTTGTEGRFHPPAPGQYGFRVRAVIDGQAGPPSAPRSFTVTQMAIPELYPLAPVNAGALDHFSLSWRGVPKCAFYEVQEARTPSFNAEAAETFRVDHPLQKLSLPTAPRIGTRFYRVRAVDHEGGRSAWSSIIRVEIS